ncbi:MAG: RecQ family ATP-dependent DNA helicase [Bacteroidota bacterium]
MAEHASSLPSSFLESPPDLDQALRSFGFPSFRPGQREALETLYRHRHLLLVAPTGGGKSLIYQLPATMLPGTTLVISPLISLMHDQVDALEPRGVRATYLASTLRDDEVAERLWGIRRGAYRIVYVAPERLPFPGFRDLVRSMGCPLIAIDEAHCISQWGHDFRPEYLQIRDFLRAEAGAMVLACTATATPAVRDDILLQLGLGSETPQIVRGFARPNLALRAQPVAGAAEAERAVDHALREWIGEPSAPRGGAIIYCLSRKDAEAEAKRLRAAGWSAGWYHAGLSGDHRSEVQGRFMRGELSVVAATNAFGMGIDRADVRLVIHLSPPDSIEAYYQEVGRAGRDGEPAAGLLLLRTSDIPRRRHLLERSALESGADPALFEHKWTMFLDLIRWAEGGSCRHDAILRYFGDEAETLHGCGRCDVCAAIARGADPADAAESARVVSAVLAAVAWVHERLGQKVTVKFLRGEADDRLERAGLVGKPGWGALTGEDDAWCAQVLQRCVAAGWVDFTRGEYPMLMLLPAGRAVLEGRRPGSLILPPRGSGSKSGKRSRKRDPNGRRSGVDPSPFGPIDRDLLPDREPQDELDEALFEELREWRRTEALEGGVPAFVVATDRALRDIAATRPRTRDELLTCHGIGPQKAAKYGAAILKVVARALPLPPSQRQ